MKKMLGHAVVERLSGGRPSRWRAEERPESRQVIGGEQAHGFADRTRCTLLYKEVRERGYEPPVGARERPPLCRRHDEGWIGVSCVACRERDEDAHELRGERCVLRALCPTNEEHDACSVRERKAQQIFRGGTIGVALVEC